MLSHISEVLINRLYNKSDLVAHHQDYIPYLHQKGVNLNESQAEAIVQSGDVVTPLVAFKMDNTDNIPSNEITPAVAKDIYLKHNVSSINQIIDRLTKEVVRYQKVTAKYTPAEIFNFQVNEAKYGDIFKYYYDDVVSMRKFLLDNYDGNEMIDTHYSVRSFIASTFKVQFPRGIKAMNKHLAMIDKFFKRYSEAQPDVKLAQPVKREASNAKAVAVK